MMNDDDDISKKNKNNSWFSELIRFTISFTVIAGLFLLFRNIVPVISYVKVIKNKDECIELVRNYNKEQYGEYVETTVGRIENIYDIYGWDILFVKKNTYLVSYTFDEDNDDTNGFIGYFYEVELSSGTVRFINNDETLEKKYSELGFISW